MLSLKNGFENVDILTTIIIVKAPNVSPTESCFYLVPPANEEVAGKKYSHRCLSVGGTGNIK